MRHKIAVAYGDGIGPEIMEAVLFILQEAGANLDTQVVEIGEKVYLRGCLTGIEPESWNIIRNAKAFFKAPITTPQGGGYKSLNVTVRTTLGLYANVRPCISYFPFVDTKHPNMDIVIIRENEEDLYAGIEYRQTTDVTHSIKLISRPGCEKIVRYAFEYARTHGRRKVTCFSKDNIMKFSDGLFHKVFDEISAEYPDLEKEHWIVDIGAAKMSDGPENFDVIVMPNLYGDILSDIAAEISGSVGIAGSANIGDHGAMFEAIHGSAPRRAGQNLANPSGLLLAAVMMLAYLGENEIAARIHNAWLTTLEEGFHTYDIFNAHTSKVKVGTKEFAQAVARNLGHQPKKLHSPSYKSMGKTMALQAKQHSKVERKLIGVDIFLHAKHSIEKPLTALKTSSLKLQAIFNRGAKIWPEGHPETFCIDQWRCRFIHTDRKTGASYNELIALQQTLAEHGFDIIKTENLYLFDGAPGFSSAELFQSGS